MSETILPRFQTLAHDFYIASGWFNEAQASDLEIIKKLLDSCEANYFSPKDEIICPADADAQTRANVFSGNISAIRTSKFVIVNTRDKDMGTIFEAGVAYHAHKPIIYVAFGLPKGGTFNLMLAASGVCVCTDAAQLELAIKNIMSNPGWRETYNGTIE